MNDVNSSTVFGEKIIKIVRSNSSPKVKSEDLKDFHAGDIAAAMSGMSEKEDPKKAAQVLERMEPDDAVDLLKASDPKQSRAFIELMDSDAKKDIMALAAYDEDTIGSRMTTNFVTVGNSLTIQEAMKSVVSQAAEHDNVSVIYILDEHGVYDGALDLKDLIVARQKTPLEEIVSTTYPYVYADEKIEDCLPTLKDYSEESIPVLSDDNHILGVVTLQDVMETMDDEMNEDYAKLGGLSAEEDLEEPVKLSTQSLAVTIRVLMDEKLTGKQKAGLVFKEMRVGFLNGAVLGILALGTIGAYIMLIRKYPAPMAFAVSACIGISLIVAMTISSLVGTGVPIFFKKIKIDPAVASGPLITTITDLVGVVTYYSLAWFMLIHVLHM